MSSGLRKPTMTYLSFALSIPASAEITPRTGETPVPPATTTVSPFS